MTPQLQKVLALAHLAAHNIPKKTFLRSAFMWKSHYVFTIKTTSVQVLLLKKLGENDQCKSAFPPSLKVLQMPNVLQSPNKNTVRVITSSNICLSVMRLKGGKATCATTTTLGV